MEINHRIHSHPLFPREDNNAKGCCFICEQSVGGNPFYVCEKCEFYLHKLCANNLPSIIDHPFHPQHRLELWREGDFHCGSCHKKYRSKPRFICDTCFFVLDVKCALMPNIKPEGDCIQHCTHQHPMSLCSQDHDKFLICFACKKITSEAVYGCIPCEYFLHKSCSELPVSILHTLHPRHALVLEVGSSDFSFDHDLTFGYYCRHCIFFLEASHLIPILEDEAPNLKRLCFLCSKQHLDSNSCIYSKYFVNQTCIWLPETIEHQFHSHKPLQLLLMKDFWCESCHKWFGYYSCYGCDDCNFHMDVKCALMPNVQYNERDKYFDSSIPHRFSHQHPLCLITQDFGIMCSVCQMTRTSPIYGCLQCDYFLHQSCIELPSEIENPLHDRHKLTMELVRNEYCQLCLKKSNGFFFGCVQCKFYIGIECYSLIPKFNIWYEYHDHPLCLVEKSYCEKCDANDIICGISKLSSELRLTKTCSLRCVECNYDLHLLCGPLPCTIKCKNHLHALTLEDYAVEDDCDEYYCDICEEARNPRLRVYFCEYCEFSSHVHCVISEILNALKNDPLQVKLRIVGDLNLEGKIYQPCYNVSGKVLNFKNVLDSLSKEETSEFELRFRGAKLYSKDVYYSETESETEESGSTSKDEGNDIIQELSMYNDDILHIMGERLARFQLDRKHHIQPNEYELKVVKVDNNYMITSNFASLLSALFVKYGDFSARARFKENVKSVVFYIFCRMVNSMRRTCLADITDVKLYTWLYYFRAVSIMGFDVEFFRHSILTTFLSFTGLRAMKLEEELSHRVAQEIVDLEKKMSEIKSKIDERKELMLRYKLGMIAQKSKAMGIGMGFARRLKWRPVGKDIV